MAAVWWIIKVLKMSDGTFNNFLSCKSTCREAFCSQVTRKLEKIIENVFVYDFIEINTHTHTHTHTHNTSLSYISYIHLYILCVENLSKNICTPHDSTNYFSVEHDIQGFFCSCNFGSSMQNLWTRFLKDCLCSILTHTHPKYISQTFIEYGDLHVFLHDFET